MTPEQFGAILGELLGQGFELPIYCATVGNNGYVLAVKWERDKSSGSLTCSTLAENAAGGMVVLPINMMFVDRRGEAARVVVRFENAEPEIVH